MKRTPDSRQNSSSENRKYNSRQSNRQQNSGPTTRKAKPVLKVYNEAAKAIKNGHPWVFRSGLTQPASYDDSTIVDVIDIDGYFLARGYYESEGAVAARIMTRNKSDNLNETFIKRSLYRALDLRKPIKEAGNTAYRIIHSENDRFPGITVTRFGDFLVSIIYTPAARWVTKLLYPQILEMTGLKGIYEQERFRPVGGVHKKSPARSVLGEKAPLEVEIVEDGLKFLVDITAPMGVGFFPDYRLGRKMIRDLSPGRKVLNLFSHTGSFSVNALYGGAAKVVSVDISQKANTRAMHHTKLNDFDPHPRDFITDDAIKTIVKFGRSRESFDLAIVDPPPFSTGKVRNWSTQKDYSELVTELLKIMEPGSKILFTSNTAKMSMEDFERTLAAGARGRPMVITHRVSLPQDYPQLPGFTEGSYLKSLLVQVY
jgi:23S rRNA (cytosine1962-C5)-methyltransferase